MSKESQDICNSIQRAGSKIENMLMWVCLWLFFIAIAQCSSSDESALRYKIGEVSNELREIKGELKKLNNKNMNVDVHVEQPAPVEKQ